MSNPALQAVWDHADATGTDLVVLLSLADQANDDGYCWPGVGSLARRARVGERAVQRSLQRLHDHDQIVIEHRSGRSSIYWLTPLLERRSTPVVHDTPVLNDTPVVEDTTPPSSTTPPPPSPATPTPVAGDTRTLKNPQGNPQRTHTPAVAGAARSKRWQDDPGFAAWWTDYRATIAGRRGAGAAKPAWTEWRKLDDDDRAAAAGGLPVLGRLLAAQDAKRGDGTIHPNPDGRTWLAQRRWESDTDTLADMSAVGSDAGTDPSAAAVRHARNLAAFPWDEVSGGLIAEGIDESALEAAHDAWQSAQAGAA